jgi:hypothetical protein
MAPTGLGQVKNVRAQQMMGEIGLEPTTSRM